MKLKVHVHETFQNFSRNSRHSFQTARVLCFAAFLFLLSSSCTSKRNARFWPSACMRRNLPRKKQHSVKPPVKGIQRRRLLLLTNDISLSNFVQRAWAYRQRLWETQSARPCFPAENKSTIGVSIELRMRGCGQRLSEENVGEFFRLSVEILLVLFDFPANIVD